MSGEGTKCPIALRGRSQFIIESASNGVIGAPASCRATGCPNFASKACVVRELGPSKGNSVLSNRSSNVVPVNGESHVDSCLVASTKTVRSIMKQDCLMSA